MRIVSPSFAVLAAGTFALCDAFAQTPVPVPASAPAPAASPVAPKPKRLPRAPAPEPGSLPGKGLAQHDFLYAGQWDTRNPLETMFLVRGGKVVWTHTIPDKDIQAGKTETAEWSDIHLLSNGNVLYARKTGATEITSDKQVVWNYDAPAGTEVHSAQPIGLDKVFLCQNGFPPKVMLINKKTGQIEMEHELEYKKPDPDDPKKGNMVHGQLRHVRITKAGTYLIAYLNLGKVVEYDKSWKEIWSCPAPSVFAAVRLKNGNTLLSGNQHGWVREVNPKGETVWEIQKDDLPGFPIYSVQEANRLANGNTVISNWGGGLLEKEDWDKCIQVIEVTPDKKVVWALHEWKNPDLGPSSFIQLLDEPGADENGDLMR
jgi:hypothetical protein